MPSKTFILSCILLIGFSKMVLSQPKPFVPTDFKVPAILETPQFRARMLTVNDVVKDYDAVMTSIEHLQKSYQSTTWPTKEMTLEQNLIDLGWHQKEFQTRRSFTYTIINLDESQVLGCLILILPPREIMTRVSLCGCGLACWTKDLIQSCSTRLDNGLQKIGHSKK